MGKKRGRRGNSTRSIWMVAGIAVAVVAVLIVGNVLASRPKKPTSVVSDQEFGAVRNVKGKADAKVTVVEYNDYL